MLPAQHYAWVTYAEFAFSYVIVIFAMVLSSGLANAESNFLAWAALCEGVEARLWDYANYWVAAGGSSVWAENDGKSAWWELHRTGNHGFAWKFTLASLK
jgi:hypothetical protein